MYLVSYHYIQNFGLQTIKIQLHLFLDIDALQWCVFEVDYEVGNKCY